MATAAHGHPSSFQGPQSSLQVEQDVERRLTAFVAKDQVRIKEFFIDFDKLRKGTVGEAAVSYKISYLISSAPALALSRSVFLKTRSMLLSTSTAYPQDSLTTPLSSATSTRFSKQDTNLLQSSTMPNRKQ
jgi:hypothetical protein